MAKRVSKVLKDAGAESSFELDLAPMLALMVTLIPIMLLSTVFVKIMIIETPLPQVVQNAIAEDRKKKDRDILISVYMDKAKGFELRVKVNGRKVQRKRIPRQKNEWNFQALHIELVNIKKQYPKTYRLDLNPGPKVPYDSIVKLMDAARRSKASEAKFYILDKATNKKVETNVMFPDVVFGNVLEG